MKAALTALALVSALATAASPTPPDDHSPHFSTTTTEDSLDVNSWWIHDSTTTHHDPVQQGSERPAPRLVRVTPACDVNDIRHGSDDGAMCPAAVRLCPRGGYMVWVFTTTTLNNPQPADWVMSGNRCVRPGEDRPGTREVPAFTEREFARLPLPAGGVNLEPGTGEVLINVPTNAYVTAKTVTLRTRLLGVRVEVQATPDTYTWTFGDGGRLVTKSPGHPYPDMSTTHTYTQPGHYLVTLATTYVGRYRVEGSRDWLPVDGTATVNSRPVPLEAYETRAVLVP